MSSINDYLLNELLIIIFGYLTRDDRKICRLVCQRWNDLILNEVKFRSDWHLNVDPRILTPSDFVLLLESRVQFSSITLDISNRSKNVNVDNLVNVLTQIGKSVTKIAIESDFEHHHRIINCFPLLKSIEIDSKLNLKFMNCNTNVEHLKLTYFHYFPRNILDLFQVFPNIKNLDYDDWQLNDHNCMIKSFRTAPTLWKVFYWVNGAPSFNAFQTEFLQFEKLNLDRFCHYSVRGNELKYEFLTKVTSKFPDIPKIELQTRSFVIPPAEIQHKITQLNASLQDEDFTFSVLKNFKSLQKLVIDNFDVFCPIGHQIFTNTSLKTLNLKEGELFCEECWNTLIVSVPNVEHFRLNVRLSYDKLIKAISHWKNLKHLKINLFYHNCVDAERFEALPTCTSMLEYLHCMVIADIFFQLFLEFLKCLPELKYLNIGYRRTLADAKKTADALVTYCKKLRVKS
uniref:CSON014776 protein n=1 Tax=Culicoides sonorensis TaxID=179676 RepID=A0A336LRY2_CULSO